MLRTSRPDSMNDPAADGHPGVHNRPRRQRARSQRSGTGLVVTAGALVLIGAHLLLARSMAAPIIHPDELGYLDNARYLAHGGLRPETEYYPGVSLLFTPLWWTLRDPFSVWRGALVINGFLAGGSAVVSWVLCKRLAGDLSVRWRLAVAGVVSLYPPLMVYGDLALAECLFVLLFGAVVLLAGRAFAGGTRGWWAALGLASGALVMVHPRGLAVVVAVVAMAALILRPRRRDAPAALALAAGLTISLACTRILVTATRGPALNGFAAYRPDGILSKSLSLHGMISLLWEAGGQMFYLSVATVGLLPLGLFVGLASLFSVARGARTVKELTRAFAALSFVGVWGLSSLFMNLGNRTDKLVYGRYNEGAIVPLLIVALAEVVTAGASHRLAGRLSASRRWLIIGAGTTIVTGVMLGFGRTHAALHGTLNPVNVLGIYPLMRRLGGGIDVAQLAGVALAVLFVLALISWGSPAVMVLVVSGLFVASTIDLQSSYLTPGSRARADQTVIGGTLAQAGIQFGLTHDCIAFDPTINSDFDYFALRFLLPGRKFRWFDPAHGAQACGPLVVSGDPGFAATFPGPSAAKPRLVTLENDGEERLWVLAGPLQDRLAAAGWLLPDPTPGVLPSEARHAVLRIVGTPSAALAMSSGATRRIRVLATHDAAGSPWPAAAGIRQGDFAVRLAVQWFRAGEVPDGLGVAGGYVALTTLELEHTAMPGESIPFTVPLVARSAGTTADGPLPPGQYKVRLTMIQEDAPAFTSPGITLDVTVASKA